MTHPPKRRGPATMADVATAANVSSKTVSRVLNGNDEVSTKTRRQVQEAIEQLGYRPNHAARSLASQRSQVIGMMIPTLTNPFFPWIVSGIEQVALDRGYYAIQNGTSHDVSKCLQLFSEMRAEGIIMYSAHLTDDEIATVVRQLPNTVLINRVVPGLENHCVCVNSYVGVREVVALLVSTGRSRLAYLGSPGSHNTACERARGFADGLEAAGIDAASAPAVTCNDASVSESYVSGKALLEEHPNLDAVVCYNDIVAGGLLKAASELGVSVPDDIAVTGFDDIDFAQVYSPPLTTLNVPKRQLGIAAAELLLQHINGEPDIEGVEIVPELIVREST